MPGRIKEGCCVGVPASYAKHVQHRGSWSNDRSGNIVLLVAVLQKADAKRLNLGEFYEERCLWEKSGARYRGGWENHQTVIQAWPRVKEIGKEGCGSVTDHWALKEKVGTVIRESEIGRRWSPWSLRMGLPEHACLLQLLAGGSCGEQGLCASVVTDYGV